MLLAITGIASQMWSFCRIFQTIVLEREILLTLGSEVEDGSLQVPVSWRKEQSCRVNWDERRGRDRERQRDKTRQSDRQRKTREWKRSKTSAGNHSSQNISQRQLALFLIVRKWMSICWEAWGKQKMSICLLKRGAKSQVTGELALPWRICWRPRQAWALARHCLTIWFLTKSVYLVFGGML